jgi:enoyl-CoA hydratase
MPVFAEQAYEWGLVNHVVPADELLAKAEEIASNMVQCVPHILQQYKSMIDEGYSKPYADALAWETQQAIESAKQAMAAMIAARKDKVMEKGRSEKS